MVFGEDAEGEYLLKYENGKEKGELKCSFKRPEAAFYTGILRNYSNLTDTFKYKKGATNSIYILFDKI